MITKVKLNLFRDLIVLIPKKASSQYLLRDHSFSSFTKFCQYLLPPGKHR